MYNIIRTRNIWLSISGLLVLASICALVIWGLRPGIDFTGGTLMEVKIESKPETSEVIKVTNESGIGDAIVQPVGESNYLVKMRPVSNDERQTLLDNLNTQFQQTEEIRFESIGPSIGKELQKKAINAIIFVLVAIILYITWSFRKVSAGPVPSWVYGVGAIVALIHDIAIVLGLFSVLGAWKGIEIDSLFITALLTVLGFSVHDTIVVYDRIREQIRQNTNDTFEQTINKSIHQTLTRSLNTSLTVLFVLFALLLFGGESIRYFVVALLVGITAGTYSSIFIASPLLLIWQQQMGKRG